MIIFKMWALFWDLGGPPERLVRVAPLGAAPVGCGVQHDGERAQSERARLPRPAGRSLSLLGGFSWASGSLLCALFLKHLLEVLEPLLLRIILWRSRRIGAAVQREPGRHWVGGAPQTTAGRIRAIPSRKGCPYLVVRLDFLLDVEPKRAARKRKTGQQKNLPVARAEHSFVSSALASQIITVTRGAASTSIKLSVGSGTTSPRHVSESFTSGIDELTQGKGTIGANVPIWHGECTD